MALFDPHTGDRLFVVVPTEKGTGRLLGFFVVRESALANLSPSDLISIPANYPDLMPKIVQKVFDGSMANDSTFRHVEFTML